MVRAGVEIDKKLMRLKTVQKQKPHRLDLRVLKKLTTPFRTELTHPLPPNPPPPPPPKKKDATDLTL